MQPELVARTWLRCSGELEGKLPPRACKEEGSKQGSEGGHPVFTSANLPRCHMINPSWRQSDLLRGKGGLQAKDGQISPFPDVL